MSCGCRPVPVRELLDETVELLRDLRNVCARHRWAETVEEIEGVISHLQEGIWLSAGSADASNACHLLDAVTNAVDLLESIRDLVSRTTTHEGRAENVT